MNNGNMLIFQMIQQQFIENNEQKDQKDISIPEQIQKLIQKSKRKSDYNIQCCINKQILLLKEIFTFIIDTTNKLNAWESLTTEIVKAQVSHQQQLEGLINSRDQEARIKQIVEDHNKKTRVFTKIIIGQEKINLKQQQQFTLYKQIQTIKDNLKDMKAQLIQKQYNVEEYYIKLESDELLKNKVIQVYEIPTQQQYDEMKEFFRADKICMKELYDQYQVNDSIEDPSDQNLTELINDETFKNINENSEYSLIQQGLIQMKLKCYEKASQFFEQAIKLNPNNPKAYHCQANCQFLLNQIYKANDLYTKAIIIDPNYESCYLNQLRHFINLKIYRKEANKLLQEIKQKFPFCKKVHHIEKHLQIKQQSKKDNLVEEF